MKNVFKDFLHRNEMSASAAASITGLSRSAIYKLQGLNNQELLNIKFITLVKLEKIGFNLKSELSQKYGGN